MDLPPLNSLLDPSPNLRREVVRPAVYGPLPKYTGRYRMYPWTYPFHIARRFIAQLRRSHLRHLDLGRKFITQLRRIAQTDSLRIRRIAYLDVAALA